MTVANPLITAGASKVFASSGTNVLTLYGVQSEVIRKSAGLVPFPMPVSDSNASIYMDLMGTTREITIEGIVPLSLVGSDNLYKYAADLVGLGNNTLIFGTQGTTAYGQYVYTPECLNRGNASTVTISGVVSEARVTSEKGNPNSLSYSLTILEFGTLV